MSFHFFIKILLNIKKKYNYNIMSGGQCSITDYDNQSLSDKLMDGGLGYGSICFPQEIGKYILLIIFPPLYVLIQQWNSGFDRIDRILVNFLLTSFFYFPGLLHALSLLKCGSMASPNNKNVNADQCKK